MTKKFFVINVLFFILGLFTSISNANLKIIASVENEIITNYDVLKEGNYLKILNPNLKNFNEDKIEILSTQSLINEIIKKKEISKYIDLVNENTFLDRQLNELTKKLGYVNLNEFSNYLLNNKSYNLDELKSKVNIELFWNELIFNRYNNQIKINKNELIKKLETIKSQNKEEFLLSEIVFKKNNNENINDLILKIEKSIKEIGFENTANIFSISNSAKYGGKLDWISEDILSKEIYKNIFKLKKNEISNIIKLGNNFILFKVNDRRVKKKFENRDKELQELIRIEQNQKLEKFSRIYFNKIKSNYKINEK